MIPQLEFSISTPWLAFLFAALSIALAIYTYRGLAVSTPLLVAFIALRSLALFLTLLLLVEPALSRITRRIDTPKLALVIDGSESMTIADGGMRRDSLTKQLLVEQREKLQQLGDLEQYEFSTTLGKRATDSIAFAGKQTNLSEAITALGREKTRENISAALLFSDGAPTAGESPLYTAESATLPIYTVLIGDTTEKKDIVLRRVLASQTAIAGTTVPISAVITQSGFQNAKVEVTLTGERGVIAKKTIDLAMPEQSVGFETEVKEIGEQKFRVSVSRVDGEFSSRNNEQSVFINVLKSKKKVVVISALPDPETGAVRNALALNQNLEAVFFTQKSPTEFLEGAFSGEAHKDADAAILIGFPSTETAEPLSQNILKFLTSNRISALSFIGLQSSGNRLKNYEPVLAVRVGRTGYGDALDNNVFTKLTAQASSSPVFKAGTASVPLDALKGSPPMSYLDFDFKPKPTSDVLLQLVINSRPTERIILATAKLPDRKAVTMCGVQFWHFALSADSDVRAFYQQTILNAVEWLSTRDDIKRFQVQPTEKIFDATSRISFNASLQDETLQPIPNAIISLKVSNKQTKETFSATFDASNEAGLYNAAFETLPKGDYAFNAEAKLGERSLGTSSGSFAVSETGAEFRSPRADADMLREIARRSGGKFYTAKDFEAFFADIKRDAGFQPVETEEKNSVELANIAPTLFLILALLSLEWLLRKLNALP